MASQMIQMVMRTGPTPGKTYPLSQGQITVGRDASCDIVINDAEISRHHAKLTQQADGYVLEDMGSTNGTFVDGQRLMGPHILRPGDLVLLGENVSLSYETVVYDEAAAAAAAAAPAPEYVPPSPLPPTPMPAPQPAPQYYAPQYSAPPSVVEYVQPELPAEPKKSNSTRNWILAGCGCLVLIVACVVAAAFAIDHFSLWCKLPAIGPLLGCP